MKRVLVNKAPQYIGERVRLCGWASKIRDHGSLIFVDLRDWSGKLQVVIDSSNVKNIAKIGLEYVFRNRGCCKKEKRWFG